MSDERRWRDRKKANDLFNDVRRGIKILNFQFILSFSSRTNSRREDSIFQLLASIAIPLIQN